MALLNGEHSDLGFGYYPILLQLGLTYRCNLKCPHCYALYRRDPDELSFDEIARLVDDAWQLGASKVVYSHGENLIRKDFHDVARYIADRGYFQTLMANGYLLRHDEQVKKLVASGVNKVMISVDSSDPDEHNANRGLESAFQVAVGAIKRLKEHGGIGVGMSMAIENRNYARIEEVVELGAELGVDFISLMQVRPNLPNTFERYDWSGYQSLAADLYELILRYRGTIDVYTHDPFMISLMDDRIGSELAREDFIAHNQCNVGKYMMSICPNGDVTGCNFIEHVVGNLRVDSVETIWNRLVDEYDDGKREGGPCSGCGKLSACKTGCKAFHLPFETRYDKRCEGERFGEWTPEGLAARRRQDSGQVACGTSGATEVLLQIGVPR